MLKQNTEGPDGWKIRKIFKTNFEGKRRDFLGDEEEKYEGVVVKPCGDICDALKMIAICSTLDPHGENVK